MNLFFIHTPMQILVAQNLIIKKNLKSNYLILGNTGKLAEHFYITFDKMLIDDLWIESYKLGNLDKGIFSFSNPLKSYFNLINFSKKTKKIIHKNSIKSIYFGDINHPAYIFLAEKYSFTKNIYFFEEGLSNYTIPILKKKFNSSTILNIKKIITDKIIYSPLGVKKFSKYTQSDRDCSFDFKINKKYNILPVKDNSFDEIIKFDIYLSNYLQCLLGEQQFRILNDGSKKNILYLSTSATYLFSNPYEDEIKILDETLNREKLNFRLLIKFHPKDLEEKKKLLRDYLDEKKIEYIELFKEVPFPIEVLFNKINIDFLFGYGSSSQLYFEILCLDKVNLNLFYTLVKLYKNKNIKNQYPYTNCSIWDEQYLTIFKKKPLEFI